MLLTNMILVTLTYMDGWMYVRTVVDVMAITPRFLAWMGYHIFLNNGAARARSSAIIASPSLRYMQPLVLISSHYLFSFCKLNSQYTSL